MDSSAAKTVLFVCLALVVTQSIIVYQTRSHNKIPSQPIIRSGLKPTTASLSSLENRMPTELKYPSHETELMTKQMTNNASPTSTLKVIHKRKIHQLNPQSFA